jgi:hypothetical protein
MASFLPTEQTLIELGQLMGREPSDPKVVELSISWCSVAT